MRTEEHTFTDRYLKFTQLYTRTHQVYQDYCTRNKNNYLRCQFPSVVERYFK